jgi:phospholipid/cholesterol/gamma-HCH transport system substrate-binding protein
MSGYHRNVLVGVVVLVGLGMLAWMILQFANKAATFFLTTGSKITLTASAAGGLSDGSPVTYKGVNVGRVTGVRRVVNPSIANGEDVVIDALIQADPPLPANLHGRIRQTSLLGGSAMIELEPNPENAPPQGTLTEGANLRAESTADFTSLGNDIGKLSASMQKTIESVNQVIGDPKVQEDIRGALSNARETLQSANRVATKLDKITESLDKTVNSAGETMTEARGTVKDAREEIKKMSDSLNQRLEQLASSLQNIQSITQKIDQGKGTAGQLVNDAKLYESLADTAAELKLMVKDMRRLIQQWEQEGIIKL